MCLLHCCCVDVASASLCLFIGSLCCPIEFFELLYVVFLVSRSGRGYYKHYRCLAFFLSLHLFYSPLAIEMASFWHKVYTKPLCTFHALVGCRTPVTAVVRLCFLVRVHLACILLWCIKVRCFPYLTSSFTYQQQQQQQHQQQHQHHHHYVCSFCAFGACFCLCPVVTESSQCCGFRGSLPALLEALRPGS